MLRTERARYANMETSFRRRCQAMLAKYEAADIEKGVFVETFSRDLYRFQVQMYLSGRRMAGRWDSSLGEAEAKMLHGQHAREMKYFHNFVRDMDAGAGRMPYAQRMDLYALGGYSVYLRGAVENFPDAALIKWEWIITPEAESCDTCVRNAKMSKEQGGFTLGQIQNDLGFPGEKTICLSRCRCHLKPKRGKLRTARTRPTGYTAEVARAARLQEWLVSEILRAAAFPSSMESAA